MGELFSFSRIVTPYQVFADPDRFFDFTDEIRVALSEQYDEDIQDRLVCFCMHMYDGIATDELVKLLDNPEKERRWRSQPIRYMALVGVVRDRFLDHD